MKSYDAIIVGSGPNGFAAAITLQRQGLSTLLLEGADSIGGGMRTKELTLPGFRHDVCSAIHPMAMASPFFKSIPLQDFGLEFIPARYEAAHPLDSGEVAVLHRSLERTADELGEDGAAYRSLLGSTVDQLDNLLRDTMGPLRFPKAPFDLASFGCRALPPAEWMARRFKTEKARALWAGMVAHGMQPLSNWTTSAIGMMLLGVGHRYGWAIPKGGSQSIADALEKYYLSLGGEVQRNCWVGDVRELPSHKLLMLDLTPQQLLQLQGVNWSGRYRRQLECYRYGMGVFKVDWALSEPTPFKDECSQDAATVHLGNTLEEVKHSEWLAYRGIRTKKPFVFFAQPSRFDASRAPDGRHTGWAYCHVPHASTEDYTTLIENQMERFAPGFKDTILARHSFSPLAMQSYNPNYVGGDINGGVMDIRQLYTRPIVSLTPYRTSSPSVYICSSSTPPGGGVHGMCGWNAAKIALMNHFGEKISFYREV